MAIRTAITLHKNNCWILKILHSRLPCFFTATLNTTLQQSMGRVFWMIVTAIISRMPSREKPFLLFFSVSCSISFLSPSPSLLSCFPLKSIFGGQEAKTKLLHKSFWEDHCLNRRQVFFPPLFFPPQFPLPLTFFFIPLVPPAPPSSIILCPTGYLSP